MVYNKKFIWITASILIIMTMSVLYFIWDANRYEIALEEGEMIFFHGSSYIRDQIVDVPREVSRGSQMARTSEGNSIYAIEGQGEADRLLLEYGGDMSPSMLLRKSTALPLDIKYFRITEIESYKGSSLQKSTKDALVTQKIQHSFLNPEFPLNVKEESAGDEWLKMISSDFPGVHLMANVQYHNRECYLYLEQLHAWIKADDAASAWLSK
ncbi:hypothetical protein [Paenibacillus sp. KR2-11]|nr:hypothetical protein [Paenibacillus caseinilyticus]